MITLNKKFGDRAGLIAYVKQLAPWAEGEASSFVGGQQPAQAALKHIDPLAYARTRNYGDGHVTKLSPYIHHGIISLNTVRNVALERCPDVAQLTKFIQQLAWRDFWQQTLATHPEYAWNDVEPYKTGFSSQHYADELPEDIVTGTTGVACLDAFIHQLRSTGYLHNHSRLYLASYVVHFRCVKWQVGAKWFLHHLLDGDVASNNLSWQWVASTFSNKPYIFNLKNVQLYFGDSVDTTPIANKILDATYEELQLRLFPNCGGFS